MKVRLLSTKNGLKSASLRRIADALKQSLGYKVWRSTQPKPKRLHFTYGDCVDKLTQYKWFALHSIPALEFTTEDQIAQGWLEAGYTVFGRKLLNASCGDGIIILDNEDAVIPACPVYTKYKKKKREFRVHVFKDKVVSILEKKRKSNWQGQSESKIRNLANGYVFCQEYVLSDTLRKRIEEVSRAASKVCKSDFRGVDVGYNEKHDAVFIIEVNSAPGIEGSNVGKYIQAMKEYVK